MASRSAVIVLTLNAEAHMPSLLATLAGISQRPRQVLFVDSSSDDATAALAESAGHGAPTSATAARATWPPACAPTASSSST